MMYDPLPPATMAQVYSAMDVLLNPAMGEGFGVPVLEAAACGVPSIVTDFTAMPEVAGDAGWKVSWRPYWTPGKAWWGIADTAEIVHSLEVCYGQTDVERDVRAMELREHALEYDAEKVMADHWTPALKAVEERLFGSRLVVEKARKKHAHKPAINSSDVPAALLSDRGMGYDGS
jgi:glycosyltransferase involved in cell wall biosynthesis